MSDSEQLRKRFEKWAISNKTGIASKLSLKVDECGDYDSSHTAVAWEAWQASARETQPALDVGKLAMLIQEASDWWDTHRERLVPEANWAESLALYIAPKLGCARETVNPAKEKE